MGTLGVQEMIVILVLAIVLYPQIRGFFSRNKN